MVRVFRKIKQKFISEQRIGKYLLYAIGEIILVVIGILIALQINNWNENRKKINEKREIAKSVLVELKQNLAYSKQQEETTKTRLTYLVKLLEVTDDKKQSIEEKEFFKLSFYGLSSVNYRPILSRTNKVLSSENFVFKKSPDLLFQLTNYKLQIEDLIAIDNSNTDNWKLNMQPLLINLYPVKNLVRSMVNPEISTSKHNADLSILLDNLAFENNLSNSYIDVLSFERMLSRNLTEIEYLIEKIKIDYDF